MENLGYLFAAYTAVWLGIVLYVRHLGRRTADLHEELRELREKLERR